MEAGCPRHPGATTIGRQLQDGDCTDGWQNLTTQPWAPTPLVRQAPITLIHNGKQRAGKGREQESLNAPHVMLLLPASWINKPYSPEHEEFQSCASKLIPLTNRLQTLLVIYEVKLCLTSFTGVKVWDSMATVDLNLWTLIPRTKKKTKNTR